MKEILQRSLSPSTWTQYGMVWSAFEEFNRKIMDAQTALPALPVLPFHMILFLKSLHQNDLSSSTIRSSGSMMAFLHKLQGMPDPMETFIVRKFLQGLSNLSTSQAIPLPITRGILNRIWLAFEKTSTSLPIQYKDLTLTSFEAVINLHQFSYLKNLIGLGFHPQWKRKCAQFTHFSSFA